jgi:energy-coupling factor transport system substrate-specific component
MSKQKVILKEKSKQKAKTKTKSKQSTKQRVVLHALQKQVKVLKLRELLIVLSFIGGAAALRVPMQAIPSAEPITFFALLGGWLFGRKKGFFIGFSSLLASNFFVFGGQGPWSLFQAIGFGIAGFLGGFMRKKSSYAGAITVAIFATLAFELVMNVSSLFIFPFGLMVFLTALPFTLMHLGSNIAFALALPKAKRWIDEKAEFNEKELCLKLVADVKSKLGMSESNKSWRSFFSLKRFRKQRDI